MGKLFRWVAPAAVGSALLMVALTGVAQAGKPLALGPVKGQAKAPTHVLGKQKITGTVIYAGFSGATGSGTFIPVDPGETLDCKSKTTCTFEAIMSVQIDSGAGGGDPQDYAICFVVDGNFATCPYAGFKPADGFFTLVVNVEHYFALNPGPHTVQTQLFVSGTTTLFNVDLTYHAYNF